MKRVCLVMLATLGATACDALSGLDDFAIRPAGTGAGAGAGTGAAGAGGSPTTRGPGGVGGTGGASGGCRVDAFDGAGIDPQLWITTQAPNAYFIEQAGQLVLDVGIEKGADRFARLDSATTLSLASCPLVLEIYPGTVGDEGDE